MVRVEEATIMRILRKEQIGRQCRQRRWWIRPLNQFHHHNVGSIYGYHILNVSRSVSLHILPCCLRWYVLRKCFFFFKHAQSMRILNEGRVQQPFCAKVKV